MPLARMPRVDLRRLRGAHPPVPCAALRRWTGYGTFRRARRRGSSAPARPCIPSARRCRAPGGLCRCCCPGMRLVRIGGLPSPLFQGAHSWARANLKTAAGTNFEQNRDVRVLGGAPRTRTGPQGWAHRRRRRRRQAPPLAGRMRCIRASAQAPRAAEASSRLAHIGLGHRREKRRAGRMPICRGSTIIFFFFFF